MKAILSAVMLTGIGSSPAFAQIWHEAEIFGKYGLSVRTVEGDVSNVATSVNGGGMSFRYNCFFNERIGAFAQVDITSLAQNEVMYFGARNKADGGKFLYRFSNYGGYYEEYSGVFAGAAFRMDRGDWKFTPRLGLGALFTDQYECDFERRSRDGSTGPEYFRSERLGKAITSMEYLIDNETYYRNPVLPAMKVDFQVSFSPSDWRGYLFAGAALDLPFGKVSQELTTMSSVKQYNPQNWVEAVSQSDIADRWSIDVSNAKTVTQRVAVLPLLNIYAGCGFIIGKNRNNR